MQKEREREIYLDDASDEQMSPGWPFFIQIDEQMSNRMGGVAQ